MLIGADLITCKFKFSKQELLKTHSLKCMNYTKPIHLFSLATEEIKKGVFVNRLLERCCLVYRLHVLSFYAIILSVYAHGK